MNDDELTWESLDPQVDNSNPNRAIDTTGMTANPNPFPTITWPEQTLVEAQSDLKARFDARMESLCSLCGQRTTKDKRSINSTMARGLAWLTDVAGSQLAWVLCTNNKRARQKAPDFVLQPELPAFIKDTHQFQFCAHFGLVEPLLGQGYKYGGRTPGIWRPTSKAQPFLDGDIAVPKYIDHFNRTIIGWSDEPWTIHDAWRNHFDYDAWKKENRR